MRTFEHLAVRIPPALGQDIRAELARRDAQGQKISKNALVVELLEKALATTAQNGPLAPPHVAKESEAVLSQGHGEQRRRDERPTI